jgi:uncharacterized SAM-binding protein YcdF (DUF218 family)
MLFSPGAWLALCCVVGAVLLWLRPPAGRWLVCIGAAGFALIAALPLDQWALAPLENRFPAPAPGQHVDGIIVLGGAIDAALTADRGMPSLNGAAERMTSFVTLARRYPDVPLVFTGGPSPNRPDGPTEAEGARMLAEALGVPQGRVTYEGASTTTWENGVLSTKLVAPKPGDVWLLVTSAAHMPRSIGVFRRAGWNVIADPVGYKTFRDPAHRGKRGFGERVALLDIAAHEWLGLVAYSAEGRTSAMFPAP